MPASSSRERRKNKRQQFFKQTGVQRKAKRNTQSKPKFDTKNEDDNVVRDLGNRKKFTPHDLISVRPMNERQEDYLAAHFQQTPITLVTGYPGTSKTFLSMYASLLEVFDDSTPYDKLIIVRSAVETRSIGYLKGDTDQKLEVYELPYKGIMHELMPQFKDGYEHAKSFNKVEFMPTSFMRGRNLADCIVIVDEAQNLDYEELKTCIGRISHNCKIVITGDVGQDDLFRKREKSGLPKLIKVLDTMPEGTYRHISYEKEDIVRSELVKNFIVADFEYEE